MPSDDSRDLLYGTTGDGGAVFIPPAEAERLARWWGVLTTAETWGEVHERDADLYAALLYQGRPDNAADSLEIVVEQLRGGDGARPAGELPADDAPFRMNDHVDLGVWPPLPDRLMMEWMSADLQDAYGEVHEDTWGARWLHVPAEHLDALRADLEARGYRCRRDQAVIDRAFGEASND